MLLVGTKAPDFTLKNQDNQTVRLSDFLGKKVVLYFYPKDQTSGCTTEAMAYAEAYPTFQKLNTEVIGISKDNVASHKKFATKYELPFPLLADTQKEAIQAYGVWQEKQLYGKMYFGIQRSTFIIDEQGMIVQTYPKVDPKTNAQEVLDYITKK